MFMPPTALATGHMFSMCHLLIAGPSMSNILPLTKYYGLYVVLLNVLWVYVLNLTPLPHGSRIAYLRSRSSKAQSGLQASCNWDPTCLLTNIEPNQKTQSGLCF